MHERILSGTDLGPLRRRLQGRLLPGGVRPDLVYVPRPGRGERLDLRRGAYDGAALFACLSIAFMHRFFTSNLHNIRETGAALFRGRTHLHHPRRGHVDPGAGPPAPDERPGGRHHDALPR